MAGARLRPGPVWPVVRCNDHIIVVIVIAVIPRIVSTDAVIDSRRAGSAVGTFATGEYAQREHGYRGKFQEDLRRLHVSGLLSTFPPATRGHRRQRQSDRRSPPLCHRTIQAWVRSAPCRRVALPAPPIRRRS